MGRNPEVSTHKSDCAVNGLMALPFAQCDCGADREARRSPVTGKKLDAGKPPLFQGVLNYFPNALKAVALVSAYGLAKYKLEYADKNWMLVENGYGRYSDALVRHTAEGTIGLYDAESGLLHDAQAAWNALARLELLMLQLEDHEVAKKGLEI